MKRFLFALALFACVVPGARKADAADVSIDFFYSNLSGGSWIEAGDYGYCWQPEIAVSNTNWRPYADGYWAYTDVGWTWVSYEDFGWATYHYGRWARLRDHGWVWVPGYEWGPAWVSWRTGGDYVGWAPLPPRRSGYGGGEVVYQGRPIGTSVDIEFDIGPAYYNFVDVRYIGAPVLREHIYAPSQNITYINRTVNVTNITYNNSVVHNYGPDYNRLSAYSTRPIQRLTLQRQTDTDFNAAAQSGNLTKVQGDRLLVAAPPALQKPTEPIAPKVVKTKVEKPDVETGWMGVTDPNAKAQLQDKMKKEDPKSVPPPQIPPRNPDALNAAGPAGSPQTDSSKKAGAADATDPQRSAETVDRKGKGNGKGRGNDKRDDGADGAAQPQQADGSAPAQGNDLGAAPAAQDDQRGRGSKNKDRRERERGQPATQPQPEAATPNVTTPDAGSSPPRPQDEAKGRGKRGDQGAPAITPPDAAPQAQPQNEADKDRRGRGKKDRGAENDDAARTRNAPPEVQAAPSQQDRRVQPPANADQPRERDADEDGGGRGRGKAKRERMDMPPPQSPAADVAPQRQAPARETMQERGRGRPERQAPAPNLAQPPQERGPAAGAPAPAREGRGKPERGNKKEKKDDEGKKP